MASSAVMVFTPILRGQQQYVRGAQGEKAVGDHAGDAVDFLFQFDRFLDGQAMHVQDLRCRCLW